MYDVTYFSNNSGGHWWLSDSDWKALENAGWKVNWCDRWLGAAATSATKEGTTMRDAIDEWESVTGQDSSELGCYSCCGPPHRFDSEHESYSPESPTHGTRYSQ